MSADLDALVASPHWRWMPGMRAVWPDRPRLSGHIDVDQARAIGLDSGDPRRPDLDDDATCGCMLGLVRKAYPGTTISHTDGLLICSTNILSPGRIVFFVSNMPLGERLAAALLAAPAPEVGP